MGETVEFLIIYLNSGLVSAQGAARHPQGVARSELLPEPFPVGAALQNLPVAVQETLDPLRPLPQEFDPEPAHSQIHHPANILGRALRYSVVDSISTSDVGFDEVLVARPILERQGVGIAGTAAIRGIL